MQRFFASISTLVFVAACAAQPEPEPIRGEPTYDKFGNYECDVIPGTNTCIPSDDEEPCLLPDGSPAPPGYICPPDGGRDPGDDDSSTSGGGRPTGTPGTPGRP